MNVRECISNYKQVNDLIPSDNRISVMQPNVLGHIWNIASDTISLRHSHSTDYSDSTTKRNTLEKIAEVFDPLGLLSPVIISDKLFLQDLWKKICVGIKN